jgi:hypothetical protein
VYYVSGLRRVRNDNKDAAAVVLDGNEVAAALEKRFSLDAAYRCKIPFPGESIFCLWSMEAGSNGRPRPNKL